MNSRFTPISDVNSVGTRLHVWGNSCAGKSTMAAKIGQTLGLSIIELDALNWEPGWVSVRDTDPDEFVKRITSACKGNRWIVAGSYSGTSTIHIWPKVQTVIWLDLPRWQLLLRVVRRSWVRSRSAELLWGNVRERFLPQLMVWRGEESLIWWIWTQHARKRRELIAYTVDPRFAHIQFVRFTSTKDAEAWLSSIRGGYKNGEKTE